jgi:DNA-binding LacI/PurR family transcriptional regulator
MPNVTIRDVARRAGVGLATVSRVINGSPLVSEETRRRVLQVIEELEFVPNPAARRLSTGKTLTVAVIAPFFTRPAFIERLRGIQNTLLESEYDLDVYNVETVKRRDECFHEIPRRERADGVIILSLSPRDEDIPLLARAETPIVLVDANHPSLSQLNRVITDDVQGGFKATQYLLKLGHRRIGFIGDWLESPFNFTSSRDRFQGYRQALDLAGMAYRPEYFGQGEHGRYPAQLLAEQMLALPERPTAIFAASDTQAIGVMQAARNAGIQVPQDLSVIGYDDIEIAELLGLTTIRQMLYESGQRGVELLLESLAGFHREPVCEVLPTELIERNTTAPPGS